MMSRFECLNLVALCIIGTIVLSANPALSNAYPPDAVPMDIDYIEEDAADLAPPFMVPQILEGFWLQAYYELIAHPELERVYTPHNSNWRFAVVRTDEGIWRVTYRRGVEITRTRAVLPNDA